MADFDYLAIDTARPREARAYRRAVDRRCARSRSTGGGCTSCGSSRGGRGGAAQVARRCSTLELGGAQADERQAADPVHPPARDAQPRLAARGIAAHDHPPDRAGAASARSSSTSMPAWSRAAACPMRWRASRRASRRSTARWSRRARARARCRRSSTGSPALLERQAEIRGKVITALAYPSDPRDRRGGRRHRADDLRRAAGGRAVRQCRPATAVADPRR